MSDNLPIFPNIPVDSIKRTMFREIEDEEVTSSQTLNDLLDLLWREPHVKTYLVSRKDHGVNHLILGAERAGTVQFGTTEMRWYRHPNYRNDFIRISQDSDWDWEKEVVATQPMLMRTEIWMSDSERRKRELKEVLASAQLAQPAQREPETAPTISDKIRRHYNDNQFWYWIVGLAVGVVGILLTL